MAQSDMSGFTKLTKKYGILHFLTLVMHCRRIFKAALKKFGGKVLKYDGDNVITSFPDAKTAVHCLRNVCENVDAFNLGKEQDYQIRVKLGMSTGEALFIQHDIVGEAWDECCDLGEETAKVGELLVTEAVKAELESLPPADRIECFFESRSDPFDHYNITFSDADHTHVDGSTVSHASSASDATLTPRSSLKGSREQKMTNRIKFRPNIADTKEFRFNDAPSTPGVVTTSDATESAPGDAPAPSMASLDDGEEEEIEDEVEDDEIEEDDALSSDDDF